MQKHTHTNIIRRDFLKITASTGMVVGSGRNQLWGSSKNKKTANRPNILWITSEDMSARWLGCYGNSTIETPVLDKFASEGFLYTHCFATAPVCAPARSSWILGINPVSTGTIYMRSKNRIPDFLKLYPDQLRANGYFTSNHGKFDYNFSNRFGGRNKDLPKEMWGSYTDTWDVYEKYSWRSEKRKKGQPFFQVYNIGNGHESGLHKPKFDTGSYDPDKMVLAKYHPDIPEMRLDYARYQKVINNSLESKFKDMLSNLEQDGLAEDTIVIYTSDHGGIVGRSKRFLYDSGTQSAHIIRIPEKYKHLWPAEKPGTKINRIVSFIDMPKTWLAITGSKIPSEMQGNIFLGNKTETPRKYAYLQRMRMDNAVDMQRAVRDKQYLYIRNYEPFRPNGAFLEYLYRAPSMKAWEKYHYAGKTDEITGAFFKPKPVEQLFDCQKDPDNVYNLADDPKYTEKKKEMALALREFQIRHFDCGFLPECTLEMRVKKHKSTIYEFIRNSEQYDQEGYMAAADLANFADKNDLPKIIRYLKSEDTGYQYWGIMACIQLGKTAAVPEVKTIMEKFINQDVKNSALHDVMVMAAFYMVRINHQVSEAPKVTALVITKKPKSAAVKRAWSNIYLLAKLAKPIIPIFEGLTLDKDNIKDLAKFKERLSL